MRNPLTIEVESRLSLLFVGMLAVFFLKIFFQVYNESVEEIDTYAALPTRIKTISSIQRNLIDVWIDANDIVIPVDVNRYRYIQNKYPDKPWIKHSL